MPPKCLPPGCRSERVCFFDRVSYTPLFVLWQYYDLDHPYWELVSDAPIKAAKKIGKAIKKGMPYVVVYKHKETGDLKEVELGLTEKQIRLRLNGTKQARKRKVRAP